MSSFESDSNNDSDQLLENICVKCNNKLTDEELDFFNKNEITLDDNLWIYGGGYICKNHWCKCMPKSSPHKSLSNCDKCDRHICKSCRYEKYCTCIVYTVHTLCDECFDTVKNHVCN